MAKAPTELHSVAAMVQLEGIPKAYLSAILNILVRYGVILSRRGPSGGYVLARSPAEITLARVVEVLEGPLFPVGFRGRAASPAATAIPTAQRAGPSARPTERRGKRSRPFA
jgi:Rrf2 family protein